MIREVTVFLAGLLVSSCLLAQGADPAREQGLRLLEEGRTTLEQKPLSEAHDYFTQFTQQHPDDAVAFYQLARVNWYRMEALAARGGKKGAEHALDEAIGNVQQSLKLNEKSADAHSLLADLYGRKISFGNAMFAGPKYGPKVDAENKRAQQLDANNPRVFASLGRQYLETPKMWGGNLDKSIECFRKSTQLDPAFDEAFVWLAIALRKKGDAAGADHALQEASRLNPHGAFEKEITAKK